MKWRLKLVPYIFKKLFLLSITVIFSVFYFFTYSVSAYSGGLLNNELLNLGSELNNIFSTGSGATDNNFTTNVSLSPANKAFDVLWYKFDNPVYISEYRLKSTSSLYIIYYDENENVLYSGNSVDFNGNSVSSNINNVSFVVLVNIFPTTNYVYEFDVFGSTSLSDVTAPSDVTDLSSITSDSEISLNFILPSDADLSYVKIYQDDVLIKDNLNENNYTVTGLTNDTTYNFKVTTVDESGNESSGSTVTATPQATVAEDTAPPKEVTNLSKASSDDYVTFTWTDPTDQDFDYVNVYQDGVFIGQSTTGTYYVTGLTADTSYSFNIKTVDTNGNESTGTSITVTTDSDPLPTIEGVSTSQDTNDDYIISWTSPTSGTVKVLFEGVEYTSVSAVDGQVTIPEGDMNLDIMGNPDGELIAVSDSSIESELVSIPAINNSGFTTVSLPFSASDLLQTALSLLALFGPFILLALAIYYFEPLKNLLVKAVRGYRERRM